MAEKDAQPRRLTDVLREELDKLAERIDAGLPGPLRWLVFSQRGAPIRPADVRKYLQAAMLAPENILEDARYQKVVPNDYVVELEPTNYERHYKPIERTVVEQWRQKLLELLNTTNSRQGRKEYRFGGRVQIKIQPAPNLAEHEVRIRCQINPEVGVSPVLACLELIPGGRQWLLREGVTVIGREEPCDICLDMPLVQQKRLISGQHAHIRHEDGRFYLYDGSAHGRASRNGTFVNGRPVPARGHLLEDGDVVILASLDPRQPRADTPGVAVFRFRPSCG
jgi:hypothetical protein